jgi:hypothetical protein
VTFENSTLFQLLGKFDRALGLDLFRLKEKEPGSFCPLRAPNVTVMVNRAIFLTAIG